MSLSTIRPTTVDARLMGVCALCLLTLTACNSESSTPTESPNTAPNASSMTTLPSSSTSTTLEDTRSTTSSSAPSSTAGGGAITMAVRVTQEVPYFESADGETLHLDVYYPDSGTDYPLVVLFHGNPVFGQTKETVETLASMIAERGAVVVTPTWGRRMAMGNMDSIARESITWYSEQGPCAVWTAVGLAAFSGADPDHLILIGEATGVLPAQVVTFDPPTEVDNCLSPPIDTPVAKAILFETDWLLVPEIWDEVLAGNPAYLETSSYWNQADAPKSTEILMLVGETSAPETVRSLRGKSYHDSEWVRLRDPDGTLADAFAASGTLDDGDMSFADVTLVVTQTLVGGGWNAQLLHVPDASHALNSEAARTFVADLALGD